MLKNSGRAEHQAVDCLDKLHALASRDKRKRLAVNDRRDGKSHRKPAASLFRRISFFFRMQGAKYVRFSVDIN